MNESVMVSFYLLLYKEQWSYRNIYQFIFYLCLIGKRSVAKCTNHTFDYIQDWSLPSRRRVLVLMVLLVLLELMVLLVL